MHIYRLTTFIIMAAAILLLNMSCSEQKQAEKATPEKARVESLATTPADIRKEAGDLANTTLTYAEEQKELYTRHVLERLAQYNQKMIDMDRKLAMMTEQAKAEVEEEVGNFMRKKEDVSAKFQELQADGGEAFEDLKEGMNKAMDEMDVAYDQAISRFKN